MNVIKIQGRLGNQLFQYAFAYSISKKSNSVFHFVEPYYVFGLNKYFKLRKFEMILQFYTSILYKIKSKDNFVTITEYSDTHSNSIIHNTEENIMWDGHFQSFNYFKEIELDVKRLFCIKRKYIKMFNEKYFDLFNSSNVTVMHIRLTDYKLSGNDFLGGKDLSLPFSYYKHCINELEKNNSIEKLIIISDDIEQCKEVFNEFKSIDISYETNSEIIDFQLILNADNLILSNSSFSWWGAFLNTKKKKVYAPKYWLGFQKKIFYPLEITEGLDWDIVDFTKF